MTGCSCDCRGGVGVRRTWLSHAASRLVPRSSSWRKPSGQSKGTSIPAGSVSRYGPINSAVLPVGTPCRSSARSAASSVEAARVSLPPRRAARASTRATADGSRSWQRKRAASAEHGHQTRFGMDSATSPGSRRVAAVRPAPTLAPKGWTDTRERSTPREASHGETQRLLSSAWLIAATVARQTRPTGRAASEEGRSFTGSPCVCPHGRD